jgi:hypothetical protein
VWVCGEITAGPKIALPEQAFRWAALLALPNILSVKPNVGVFQVMI